MAVLSLVTISTEIGVDAGLLMVIVCNKSTPSNSRELFMLIDGAASLSKIEPIPVIFSFKVLSEVMVPFKVKSSVNSKIGSSKEVITNYC